MGVARKVGLLLLIVLVSSAAQTTEDPTIESTTNSPSPPTTVHTTTVVTSAPTTEERTTIFTTNEPSTTPPPIVTTPQPTTETPPPIVTTPQPTTETPPPTTQPTTTEEPLITTTDLPVITTTEPSNDPKPCESRDYHYDSIVCVCNATYCDGLPSIQSLPKGEVVIYSSNRVGRRFQEQRGRFQPNDKDDPNAALIYVNPAKRFQTIDGFGAAFTDASGININSLQDGATRNLLRAYFSDYGLGYNLANVPFGSTDFSTRAYTYNDGNEDLTLKNFKLAAEDINYKIPLLKQAQNLNADLLLLGTTWGAPAWMKTNGEIGGSGRLNPKYLDVYADYQIKALEAYEKEGFKFLALTTGNEPTKGLDNTQVPSVGWLAIQQGAWVANNLKPALEKSKYKDLSLLAVDDQRENYPGYPGLMFLGNEAAKNSVDGFAVQWQDSEQNPSSVLTEIHDKYPGKTIVTTAARSASKAPVAEGVQLGVWDHAVNYIDNMIEHLNNWSTTWIDSGLALDLTGGPSFVPNTNVEAAIIVNATGGEFYKQPLYYAQAHITKFVPRGSERILTTRVFHNLGVVGFKRPDGATVVVVHNNGINEQLVQINDGTQGQLQFTVTGRSINTVVYW